MVGHGDVAGRDKDIYSLSNPSASFREINESGMCLSTEGGVPWVVTTLGFDWIARRML